MNVSRQSAISGLTGCLLSSRMRNAARSLPIHRTIRTYVNDDTPEAGVKSRASELLRQLGGGSKDNELNQHRRRRRRSPIRSVRPTKVDEATTKEEEVDGGNTVVRHYDQLEDGRIVPSLIEKGLEGAIQSHVDDLQRDIDDAARTGNNNIDPAELTTNYDKSAADDAFLEMLRQSEPSIVPQDSASETSGQTAEEMRAMVDGMKISLGAFPRRLHEPLAKLNEYLVLTAARGPSANVPLWTQYLKCRKAFEFEPRAMPQDGWEILWYFLSFDEKLEDGLRAKRILLLRKDIEDAGYNFTLDDRLLTCMEAQLAVGKPQVTLEEWERTGAQLNTDDKLTSRYWALGCKIYARMGQPELAMEYALKHLASAGGQPDAFMFVSLIDAYMSSTRLRATQEALAIYVRLINYSNSKLTMSIYDTCIQIFMKAQRVELAMIVFVDLMFSSEISIQNLSMGTDVQTDHTSFSPGAYLSRNQDINLDSLHFDVDELSWPRDRPPIRIPRNFQNKFFWSKLVKKLIGDGHVDWAYTTCVRMAELGYGADTRVWNGLIGAWLRSRTASAVARAEHVAWLLIDERIRLVKQRTENTERSSPVRYLKSKNKSGSKPLGLGRIDICGASATAETFSVMAEHYRLSNQRDKLQDLCAVLDRVAILVHPDFLNSLLRFDLTTGRRDDMWSMYVHYTRIDSIKPNYETFQLLWKASVFHSGHIKAKYSVEPFLSAFPSPRQLFAEMRFWASRLSNTPMPEEVCYNLLQAFGHTDDQIGTGIALSALALHFDTYPNERMLRVVVLQLAKAMGDIQEPAPGYVQRRRLDLNAAAKKRIRTVTDIINRLQTERDMLATARNQKVILDLEGKEWGDAMLPILGEVLRYFIMERMEAERGTRAGIEEDFNKLANTALQEMEPTRLRTTM